MYLSDDKAYALEGKVENACGLSGFELETWAETNGGGGTIRDMWLESSSFISVKEVLSSSDKKIDDGYFLVCIKDGVAYVRNGDKGERELLHISKTDRINFGVYATYGAEVYRTIKAKYN